MGCYAYARIMSLHLQSETVKWGLPIVVAILFGFIGAVFTWAKDWSGAARRGRLLDQATKRVEFWTKWLDAVRANGITATSEQVAAAHTELSRTADVVHGALRFWPLPEEWTPREYNARWKEMGFTRRFLMLYRQHDRIARRERLAFYAFALGIVSLMIFPLDRRPDDTVVRAHFPAGPPGATAPEILPGINTTLGDVRGEARFDECLLVFILALGRLYIFNRERRWMTPLSGDPQWIRKRRVRLYRRIAEQNGGTIPEGIFSRSISVTEIEAELIWDAENSHPAPGS